jgi:hypothetical protein
MTKWMLVGGVALVLLLAGGWYLYPPGGGDAGEDEEPAVHLWHCPNCGLEMTCPPGQEDKVTMCPRCVHEKVAFEVVTRRPGRGVLPVGVNGYLLAAGAGLVAVLALAVWLGGRVRQGRAVRRETEASTAPGTPIGWQEDLFRWQEEMRRKRRRH